MMREGGDEITQTIMWLVDIILHRVLDGRYYDIVHCMCMLTSYIKDWSNLCLFGMESILNLICPACIPE